MTIVLTLKLLGQLYLIKLSASIQTNASTRFLYNTTWFFLQIYSLVRQYGISPPWRQGSVPLYIYSPIRREAIVQLEVLSSVPLYIYSPIRPQTRALVSDHCPHPQAAESALSYKIICIYSNQYQYSFSL